MRLLAFSFFLSFSLQTMGSLASVIYGEDDRYDLIDLQDSDFNLKLSSSVALVVEKRDLNFSKTSIKVKISAETLQERENVCSKERFSQEKTVGFCTAFLVEKDILVTAGHCFTSFDSCSNLSFVFGVTKKAKPFSGKGLEVERKDIFSCKELKYHSTMSEGDIDIAVIKLDRPALGKKPFVFSRAPILEKKTSLYAMGHPLGLSLKVLTKGVVINNSDPNYFTSDLDSYSGSSGSPVLNKKTGLVEGVLVRGQVDFEERNGCYVSSVCNGDRCLGEEILRASVVREVLSSLSL